MGRRLGGCAMVVVAILVLLTVAATSIGRDSANQVTHPRGRGYGNRESIELMFSRIEQDIRHGQVGELKAVLSQHLVSRYGAQYSDALRATDVMFESGRMLLSVDLALTGIVINGNSATVTYRISSYRCTDEGDVLPGRRSEGEAHVTKSSEGWKLVCCDDLLDFLSSVALCSGDSRRVSWIDMSGAAEASFPDPAGGPDQ